MFAITAAFTCLATCLHRSAAFARRCGLLAVLLCLWQAGGLQAQEQYRSRVYVDIEQDATEAVSLSVGELEQKLNTFQDSATRASAERFLAKQYAGSKDYRKAATMIENSLRHGGGTEAGNRDLLMQLSQLYLLQKDYDSAAQALQRYLDTSPPVRVEDYVLLAQIHYQRKQYVASAAALDKAFALEKNPDKAFLQTALGVYYSIGSFERCAQVIQQLVAQDINNAELWQQWVSLYLKAGKHGPALDVMALAWEKGIPFREQDILLLTDLYAINKIPGRGARVLEEAISSGRLKADNKVNERLFRLWMLAGEREKATLSLEKTALAGGNTELQLHLAQLYMEKEQWQAMQDMVLKACDGALPERLVARANLLLGVSQLKLGDTALARRSLINATVVGGALEQASQWLQYMKAEPPTKWEKAGIAGPCYSDATRSVFTAAMPDKGEKTAAPAATDPAVAADETEALDDAGASTLPTTKPGVSETAVANVPPANPAAALPVKTTAAQSLFVGEYHFSPDAFAEKAMPLAMQLGVGVVKAGGRIAGPMHLIFPQPVVAGATEMTVRMGFPVAGNPRANGQFKLVKDRGFKCVWRAYDGPPAGVAAAFASLYADARAKGLALTGESRQVIAQDNAPGAATVKMELQLGVQ